MKSDSSLTTIRTRSTTWRTFVLLYCASLRELSLRIYSSEPYQLG